MSQNFEKPNNFWKLCESYSLLQAALLILDIEPEGNENIETEYMFVHQNLNKDSDNFQKFGLSTIDDHGRFGIYSATHINSFNNLKQNIEKHYNTMLEHVPKGGWDSYYNNVIVLLMDEYGYMYHFG